MKDRAIKLFVLILLMGAGRAFAQRFKPGIIAGLVATDIVGVDSYDTDFSC